MHRIVEEPWIEFKLRPIIFKKSYDLFYSNNVGRPVRLASVFVFAWYLSLCLYPNLSKASCYGISVVENFFRLGLWWKLEFDRDPKLHICWWWVVGFSSYVFYLIILFSVKAISWIFKVKCYIGIVCNFHIASDNDI